MLLTIFDQILLNQTKGVAQMYDQLLLSPIKQERYNKYDPFQTPPDIKQAQLHRKSTLVGITSSKRNPQFCPCCDNIINKQSLPICFKDDDLLHLGVGYPLYYKLAKYFIAIMIGIFFISGSAIYFLMTLTCDIQSTCYTLFGIPIINISLAEKTNLNKTQIVNMSTCVAIFLIVVYLKSLINQDIKNLVGKKVCPSLYTVMLQNVPNIQDEELGKWIQERFGEKPVLMNWAYSVDQLRNAYSEKHQTIIEMNRLRIKMRKNHQIDKGSDNMVLSQIKKGEISDSQMMKQLKIYQEKILKCEGILQSYNKFDRQYEKIGTVFVSFENISTVNRIIEEYQCSFFNSIAKNIFSFIKKSRLDLNGQIIIVYKAPAPKQIIWDNLNFSYIRNIIFEVLFIMTMLLVLSGALKIIFIFMNYSLHFRIEGKTSGHFELFLKAGVMSLIILVINCLMRLVIQAFTFAKKYYSYTKFQASFCLYYSIFYIINACCLVYMVHQGTKQDTAELLFADIHLIMIANAFSQPLFKLFDPIMWIRIFRRYYYSRLRPQDNPYTQQYLNKIWQGHQISNADNYQYITRVLYVTTWFASVAPVGVLISLIGIILDYWISKALLVKVYKIPQNISEDIALPSLLSLQLLPLVYICGVLQFTYKVSENKDFLSFFADFFHYGVTIIVLILSITGYIFFCKRPTVPDIDRTYTQSKIAFGFNYQTTNPITKFKGEINYLYEVLKAHSDSGQNSKIIEDILEHSRFRPEKLEDRREEVNRLKMKLHKKISENEHSQIQMKNISTVKQESLIL